MGRGRFGGREGIPGFVQGVALARRQAQGKGGVAVVVLVQRHPVAVVERDADPHKDGEDENDD